MSLPPGPAGDPAGDPGALLARLADALSASAPPGALEVQRDRSLGDRMAGRPGTVTSVQVTGGDMRLTLTADRRRLTGTVARVVRGVTISRREVGPGTWLDELAGVLRSLVAWSAADAAAVQRTLVALGVAEPGADLAVDPAAPLPGLAALPGRLAGRVPEDVLGTVADLCARLAALLDRGAAAPAGAADRTAHTVLRTATDYLPATLRAYVALPPEWAATHPLPGGGTSLDALRAQLAVLADAVGAMSDREAEADVQALLANGNFLADRFAAGPSGLLLPPDTGG